jgi:aspartyl-tRNA(Asn)/glutamyl-tRNA(Gln) amidotransferase subunit A
MEPPPFPSLLEARAALASGAISPPEVVAAYLGQVDASEPALHAWAWLDREAAISQAERLDPAARRSAPLWGIPVGIKDLVDVVGMPTTAGSRVLAGNTAAADAPVVARLREAGAVIVGKTQTHEFGYGAVTPTTANPWDGDRIAGGSSGGSAVALVAGHCLGALGTDTAGSIRIPSALCGCVGLKPRPGLVTVSGVIPLAPTLDVVGPMGRSVADVALLWQVLSGEPAGPGGVDDLKVVSAPRSSLPELEPGVASAYAGALDVLAGIAGGVPEAALVPLERFDAPRAAVLMWEALQVHRARGWWPARADDYTEETRGYLRHAERNLTAEAVEAARAECRRLAAQLISALDGADVLATPSVPCVAPTRVEADKRSESSPRRPVVMKLTRIPGPINVAGLAALSVPCGLGAGGFPVGLQLIARNEETVLRLGAAYEQATGRAAG